MVVTVKRKWECNSSSSGSNSEINLHDRYFNGSGGVKDTRQDTQHIYPSFLHFLVLPLLASHLRHHPSSKTHRTLYEGYSST